MNTISRDLERYARATWQAEPAALTAPQLHEALDKLPAEGVERNEMIGEKQNGFTF